MPKVFISYAREDLYFVKKLEEFLRQQGFSTWRDQENVYAGQNWPKAIGEAIAEVDFFIIVWTKYAQKAHFVEFEWSTAIALRKQVVPCLLDDTTLPPSLSTFNGILLENTKDDYVRIAESMQISLSASDPSHNSEVIEKLQELSPELDEALRALKSLNKQKVANIPKSIYQAGRDVVIIGGDKKEIQKS